MSDPLVAECKVLAESLERTINDAVVDELTDVQIAFMHQTLVAAINASKTSLVLDNLSQFVEAFTILRKEKKIVVKYATRLELLLIAQKIEEYRSKITEEDSPEVETEATT